MSEDTRLPDYGEELPDISFLTPQEINALVSYVAKEVAERNPLETLFRHAQPIPQSTDDPKYFQNLEKIPEYSTEYLEELADAILLDRVFIDRFIPSEHFASLVCLIFPTVLVLKDNLAENLWEDIGLLYQYAGEDEKISAALEHRGKLYPIFSSCRILNKKNTDQLRDILIEKSSAINANQANQADLN